MHILFSGCLHECVRVSAHMQAAIRLKAAVKEQLGLTLSCGVGPTKLLARLTGPLNKPDGLTVLTHPAAIGFLHSLPLRQIPSLG